MSGPRIVAPPHVEPFPPGAVRLGAGHVALRAREAMLELARAYPVDRLLAVFRANAGLDTRGAEPPGAWEGFGHPQEDAWSADDYPGAAHAQTANLLRGHYAGHFLSMLALAAASEDDDRLRRKVDEMVSGLGEVQAALAATGRYSHPGFLAAYGEWQFSRLEDFAPYGEIWAPYYTCHKIMAGLLDAHELTGNAQALTIVTAMGHWVAQRVGRLDRAHLQRMWALYIAGEYGGMNETLARLSVVCDEPAFLVAAEAFEMDGLRDAASRGVDILTGMHANQHLPQLIGYVRQYELTGDVRALETAVGVWDQVVPGRTFAHGGTGESELWGPPDTVAGHIGRRNAETCATYNLMKLARLLFSHTLDPRYLEYYERAALNHVLASRRASSSTTSPEVAYMFPVDPGALPEFDNIGTCCGGTGLENHVTQHDTVFFRAVDDAPDLWVALLAPATLTWPEHDVVVEMRSGHPWDGRTTIHVRPERAETVELTLRVRIPAWAAGAVTVRVGEESTEAEPGDVVVLHRHWTGGDVVEVDVPMTVRATGTIDDPTLQSVEYGPTLLVARHDATTTRTLPLTGLRRLDGSLGLPDAGSRLRADGGVDIAGLRYEPVWTGSDARYHMYVRDHGDDIAFAGRATGVPARSRTDGVTLLDDVWAAPAPATHAEFLDRVLSAALAARGDGLLRTDEVEQVLLAAGSADVDGRGTRPPGRVVIEEAGTATWSRGRADEIVWTLPSVADAPIPPVVRIETLEPPAVSGWYTTAPTLRLRVWDTAAQGAAETDLVVRIDDEPWRSYEGDIVVAKEGVVRVEARATDPAGRVGRAVRELSIDTTPPAVQPVVRALGSSVEISFTAKDEVSGVERIQWGGEDTFWATFQEAFVRSLTEDEQTIEFSATDRAGNEGPRERLVLPARGHDPVSAAE